MPIIDDRTPVGNYPKPNELNKLKDDVYRLRTSFDEMAVAIAAAQTAADGKAPAVHTHTISQVIGLLDALAGKAAAAHVHALDDLSDVNVAGAANGYFLGKVGATWQPVQVTLGNVTGWEATTEALIDGAINSYNMTAVAARDAAIAAALAARVPKRFNATKSTAQSIPTNGTVTILTFDTVGENTGGEYDAANNRFVAATAGLRLFEVSVQVSLGVADDDAYSLTLYKNGVIVRQAYRYANNNAGGDFQINLESVIPVAAGDQVNARLTINGTGTDVIASSTTTRFAATELAG